MKQKSFLSLIFSVSLLVGLVGFWGCSESEPSANENWGTVYVFPKLTDNDYAEKIKEGIVLLDFYADWCGPCRMMDPNLAKLHDRYGDKLTIAKIDTDRNPKLCEAFNIKGIPALFVFVDGKQVRSAVGYQDEKKLFALVEDLIDERTKNEESETTEINSPEQNEKL